MVGIKCTKNSTKPQIVWEKSKLLINNNIYDDILNNFFIKDEWYYL